MGFTKLDEGILLSSIMIEPPEVFKVWIALLAACKEDGVARVSSVGLSSFCFLPIETVKAALKKLESPDCESRSINDDGRRIKRVDGGYFVVNYQKYRELTTKEKEAQRKWESRHKSNLPDKSGHVRTNADYSASASASDKEEVQEEKKHFTPPAHLADLWPEYMETRKNKKAAKSISALERVIRKLETLAPGDHTLQFKILEKSVISGWTDVYPFTRDQDKVKPQSPQTTYRRLA